MAIKEMDVLKSWFVGLVGTVAVATAMAQTSETPQTSASAPAAKGMTVVAANGFRIGTVYRVAADGSAEVIYDGKVVTIPVSTLSTTGGKLVTTLSRSEVSHLH